MKPPGVRVDGISGCIDDASRQVVEHLLDDEAGVSQIHQLASQGDEVDHEGEVVSVDCSN